MTVTAPAPAPDTSAPLPALDPEVLFRSENPWDWLLASWLEAECAAVEAPKLDA